MENLLAARTQMGMSLVFHIIFAVIGVALPALMFIAEFLWLKTGDDVYLKLAKHWAKGTGILFAVGAVSGTVLSFELGLLFPVFMRFAGDIVGMPFSLEGFAFFTEAIFIGIYLYGWDKVPPKAHLLAGAMVAVSGAASAVFVVTANAWMNTPRGFQLDNGWPVNIDPIAAMMNPAAAPEVLHMVIASFVATGFMTAGIHAFCLLKDSKNLFHQKALAIALAVGGIAALAEPLSGDLIARVVAYNQPAKLAAFEALYKTQTQAPMTIGGIADSQTETTNFAVTVPGMLSMLAFGNVDAKVTGLNEFPRQDWPNVLATHLAFDTMVAIGSLLALVSLVAFWLGLKTRSLFQSEWFLRVLVLCAPLGFAAIEVGWCVTELGRQPWVIYGVLRTAHAVTPMPGVVYTLATITALYIFLSAIVILLMRQQLIDSPEIYSSERE
jgi:cytochrome d ubiquinol oxidase subunit I